MAISNLIFDGNRPSSISYAGNSVNKVWWKASPSATPILVWEKASPGIPDDEIWYITYDESIITPSVEYGSFGANIVSNTYISGDKGIIKFDGVVTSIPESAFAYCSALIDITLPKEILSIGDYAFSLTPDDGWFDVHLKSCTKLTSIGSYIADTQNSGSNGSIDGINAPNLTTLSENAFNGSGILRVYNLGNITSIPYAAFVGCRVMYRIDIPSTVTELGDYAIYNCNGYPRVHFHSSTAPSYGESSLDDYMDLWFPSGCRSSYQVILSSWLTNLHEEPPTGYTQYDWLQSPNNGYLNTAVPASNLGMLITTKFEPLDNNPTGQVIFGSSNQSEYMNSLVFFGPTVLTWQPRSDRKYSITKTYSPIVHTAYLNYSNMVLYSLGHLYNGTQQSASGTATGNIRLLWATSFGSKFKGKLYHFLCYNSSSEVLFDGVPCCNADGVPGMWDSVSHTFITPASGTINVGNEYEDD